MLQQLSVRNLALIDALDVEFRAGLTVFTGETGAGKSVIFEAIGLLLGARASADVIRDGCEQGSVTGVFEPTGQARAAIARKLEVAGMPASDTIIVRRVLSRQGRHRAWINEIPTTVSFLAEISGEMMEIVGQHQHLSLTHGAAQRALIDRWAGCERAAQKMREAYAEYRRTVRARTDLESARAERMERLEFARFQRDEIAALDLQAGEYDRLEATLGRARYAEKLRTGHHRAQTALYRGDGAAVERIGQACSELRKLVDVDAELTALVARLEEAEAVVSDVYYELEGRLDAMDATANLDALESRHETLRVAMRRFASDEAGLITREVSLREEIDRLENLDERTEDAVQKEHAARARACACADDLDAIRRKAASDLFDAVAVALQRLEMEGTRLVWAPDHADDNAKLTAEGWDNVRILFSANRGERPLALGRVASGGELSRLLLAIKYVMMERDPVSLCLFDEIDTGLGGQAGVALGQMLHDVAGGRQILCITHLAQIAACADHQNLVEKRVDEGRTISSMYSLDPAAREREIARMLGGNAQPDVSLAHARAMLSSR